MKRIVWVFMSTVSAVVLLFGYRTSTNSPASGTVAAAAPVSGGGGISSSGSSSANESSTPSPSAAASAVATPAPSSSSASSASSASNSASKTYTGSSVDTRWGPVQVQITVSGGKVSAVSVVEYPNSNGRDQEINQYALPTLIQETISAQSSKIDMVSGATYTSEGYIGSLQSALDKAGL